MGRPDTPGRVAVLDRPRPVGVQVDVVRDDVDVLRVGLSDEAREHRADARLHPAVGRARRGGVSAAPGAVGGGGEKAYLEMMTTGMSLLLQYL